MKTFNEGKSLYNEQRVREEKCIFVLKIVKMDTELLKLKERVDIFLEIGGGHSTHVRAYGRQRITAP